MQKCMCTAPAPQALLANSLQAVTALALMLLTASALLQVHVGRQHMHAQVFTRVMQALIPS